MTKREKRVINAFINCVRHGEYSLDYACILIEDTARYGWLSEAAKDVFYAAFEDPEEAAGSDAGEPPAEDEAE